jgi:hypothetical protein
MGIVKRTVDNGTGTDYDVLANEILLSGETGDAQIVNGSLLVDSPFVGTFIGIGARGSTATPPAVSADDDAQTLWTDRSGTIFTRPGPCLVFIQPAATTTAAAPFAAGDVVGTEISFTNAVRATGGFGEVVAAQIVSDSATTPMTAMDLYLFTSASSPAADNAANSWSDANMLLLRGIIRFPAPDISALNTVGYWTGSVFFNCAAMTLFGVMVTRGIWTPSGTAAPIVGLTIRQY